ncbi:Zinc finger BED domain-containing protein 1 [Mortierella alpina]|nr:Zinc finger BED domain-containing protein 1 [Mortierella alpina]
MTNGQDPIPDSTDNACQRFYSALLEQVKRRWSLETIPDAAIIATYRNPATKYHEIFNVRITRGGNNELLKTHAESLIVQKLLELIKSKGMPIDPQDNTGNSSDDEPENAQLAQTGGCPISRRITSELLLYSGHAFRHSACKEKYFDDPLAWWSKHSHTYSYLSFLVRQYLAIQASSVASERLFSASGNFVTKNRSSLGAITVENVHFIRRYVHSSLEDLEDEEEE